MLSHHLVCRFLLNSLVLIMALLFPLLLGLIQCCYIRKLYSFALKASYTDFHTLPSLPYDASCFSPEFSDLEPSVVEPFQDFEV